MPDRYAVIGHPIGHSQSPLIHGLFARALGHDMVYEAIDGGPDEASFRQALARFRAAGGRGLNVTLPFKQAALAVADEASDEARRAGAANTLGFEGGRVAAHNTDGIGLVRDLEANLDQPLAGRSILLLGAGGATRGVLLPLARAGAARIVIANRGADKAQALAAELAPHAGRCALAGGGYAALAREAAFDLVINATSASLAGAAPAVPASSFGAGTLAYDMMYGRGLTPFLRLAQQAGCTRLADGVGMLVEQAAESFAWWRGVRPDTRAALDWLAVPLT
ncbi:MAG TPA: shikimate dehydrogenase [Ottowia sp.]|uniref:shikimate dehydrogenase n=1 Tax=Ottowia sp. TaxID=1898956 RepID=UPI002BF3209C|nr:shikimate dehydrogenase [Ottowia sp.]HMN21698.1 shikimate dehydrogenase [Ottowia sp.]